MHEVKTPLIRLAKRDAMPAWQVWCIRGSSFIAAILLGALIFLVLGNNPISAYGTILSGSLGKSTAIRQTVKIAIPLLGTALAIAPCFKMRFWNIGAEGQITAGAVAASYFALFWADRPARARPDPGHGGGRGRGGGHMGPWCPPSSRPSGAPTRPCLP